MAYSSSQVSELVGGQMTMFANQAQYAQRVGATHGTGPMWAGQGGMSSPSFGSAGMDGGGMVAGAVRGAGGVMAGASLAGALGAFGHAGGYLDPFTSVGRGFAQGAGFGGQGAFSTMGGIGRLGMRGGMAAVGSGLAAAALPAAAMYAGYKGLEYVGEHITAGAQSLNQVGGMMQQYAGPSYGMSGGTSGGGHGRGQIQSVVQSLNELASDDVMVSLKSARSLMDKIGQMGMLTGATDPESFKQKFKQAVTQVRNIAKIMGTTLDEAAPLLGQFQKMGVWTTQDVTSTALGMKTVGSAASPHLIQSMQQGAQVAHAYGGTMSAGAMGAQKNFMMAQGLMRTGALSNQQLLEYTGGVGGVQGQQMLSGAMGGMAQGLMHGRMGKLMMAGLGATEDGSFTGGIDQERLAQFQRGGVSFNDLVGRGRKAVGSREGAASFMAHSDQIRQDMASQGGVTGLARGMQAVFERSGWDQESESFQQIMIQRMTGKGQRDAQMIQKIMRNIHSSMDDASRRRKDALDDSIRQYDERSKSWTAAGEGASAMLERNIGAPLETLSSRVATSISHQMDKVGAGAMGRTRGLTDVSSAGARRMFQRAYADGSTGGPSDPGGGDLLAAADDTPLGQVFSMEGEVQRKRQLAYLGFKPSLMQTGHVRTGTAGDVTGISMAQARSGLEQVRNRVGGNLSRMGYANPEAIGPIKDRYRTWARSAGRNKIRAIMDEDMDPGEKIQKITAAWMADDSVAKENLSRLARTQTGKTLRQVGADVAASAENEKGGSHTDAGQVFEQQAKSLEWAGMAELRTSKAVDDAAAAAISDVTDAMGGSFWGRAGSAAIGGAAMGMVLGPKGALAGAVLMGAGAVLMGGGITESEIESAMVNEEWGADMLDWVSKGGPDNHPFVDGNLGPKAKAMYHKLKDMKEGDKKGWDKVKAGMGRFSGTRLAELNLKRAAGLGDMAKLEGKRMRGRTGILEDDERQSYANILDSYAKGTVAGAEEGIAGAAMLAGKLDAEEIALLGRSGGIAGTIGALGATQGAWEGYGKGETKDSRKFASQLSKISSYAGFDIKGSMTPENQKLMESFMGEGLDKSEITAIQAMISETIKAVNAVDPSGPESEESRKLGVVATNTKNTVTALNQLGQLRHKDAWENNTPPKDA